MSIEEFMRVNPKEFTQVIREELTNVNRDWQKLTQVNREELT